MNNIVIDLIDSAAPSLTLTLLERSIAEARRDPRTLAIVCVVVGTAGFLLSPAFRRLTKRAWSPVSDRIFAMARAAYDPALVRRAEEVRDRTIEIA